MGILANLPGTNLWFLISNLMFEGFAEQELQFLERDEGYLQTGCASQKFGHL
jgi:hypothetical protein